MEQCPNCGYFKWPSTNVKSYFGVSLALEVTYQRWLKMNELSDIIPQSREMFLYHYLDETLSNYNELLNFMV